MAKPKRTRTITVDTLREALESIGWSLRGQGCEHYQIFNDYGNPTEFSFYKDEITLGESKGVFGKDGKDYGRNGHARFPVAVLTMEIESEPEHGGYPSVGLLFRGFTKGRNQTYISFYGVKKHEQ